MPMMPVRMLFLCECCALWIENRDESGCSDYSGHDHKRAEVPDSTVLTDQWGYADDWWHCDGCDTEQMPYSSRYHADVLERVA